MDLLTYINLKPLSTHGCQYVETAETSYWVRLHIANKWLFKIFNKTTAHIQCNLESQRIIEFAKKKSTKIIDDITMLVSNVFPDGKSKMLPLGSKMFDYTRQIEDLENKLNAIKMETVELNA